MILYKLNVFRENEIQNACKLRTVPIFYNITEFSPLKLLTAKLDDPLNNVHVRNNSIIFEDLNLSVGDWKFANTVFFMGTRSQ